MTALDDVINAVIENSKTHYSIIKDTKIVEDAAWEVAHLRAVEKSADTMQEAHEQQVDYLHNKTENIQELLERCLEPLMFACECGDESDQSLLDAVLEGLGKK